MDDFKYLVVGGDKRSVYLANYLIKDGKNVKLIFVKDIDEILDEKYISTDWKESLKKSDVIILPVPISKDNKNLNVSSGDIIEIDEITDKLSPNQIILGGAVTSEINNIFHNKGLNIIDYLAKEELAIFNAVPTAEGALEIAINKLPITIYKSKCLVTGFGKVSKAMINVLSALRADVTVIARKYEDLAWAQIYGCKGYHLKDIKMAVKDKDIIFNTVPHKIITSDILANIKKDCLIIDLASKPGGVDLEAAKKNNIKIEIASALPGKVAPKTSGYMIKETINHILKEI